MLHRLSSVMNSRLSASSVLSAATFLRMRSLWASSRAVYDIFPTPVLAGKTLARDRCRDHGRRRMEVPETRGKLGVSVARSTSFAVLGVVETAGLGMVPRSSWSLCDEWMEKGPACEDQKQQKRQSVFSVLGLGVRWSCNASANAIVARSTDSERPAVLS